MRDVQSVSDLAFAMMEAKAEMEAAQESLDIHARDAAQKERVYRKKRSMDWARSEGTVAARDMYVDGSCADERYEAKLAEDLRQAALERVRSARALFSGIQTLTNAWREEVAFARGGGGRDEP